MTKTHKYGPSMTICDLGYSMRWQGKSRRLFTGGRRISSRGKRNYELGREAGDPHVAPTRKKQIQTRGGNHKVRLLRCDVACVADPKTGTSKNVKIDNVVDNGANLHYIRRNIVTKGAIIKTELGDAQVTNKPGQEGTVNAVLLSS